MKSDNQQPPKIISRFLEWFCPPGLFEGIMGDLSEQFHENIEKSGLKKAKWKFTFHAIGFFRPGILFRNKFNNNILQTMLIISYLKISWRTLFRNKAYSAINIFGLSIGIATCLLTFSYVNFQLSYDNFHPDADRLYRVNETLIWSPSGGIFGSTGPALAPALNDGFPEIEEVLRINTAGNYVVRYNDENGKVSAFNEENVLAADSNFFDFFGFHLKEGNPKEALKGINKVVISDEVEKKIFGDQPALGKILLLGESNTPLLITGVTQHQPENSHFHFSYLLSIYTNPNIKKFEWSWIWTQVVTYVKLKPGADVAALEVKFENLGIDRVKPSCDEYNIDYDQVARGKGGWHFYLQPVRDIYLHSSNIGNRLGPVGDITYTIVFGIIGVFVLLIATINFINLSTARGSKRAKEIGVKKSLGALKSSLVWQFQIESIFIAILATLLAFLLACGLQTILNRTTGIQIPLTMLTNPGFLILIPFIPIVIGFLAGIYPSFYLTAFKPSQVLKGKISSGMGEPMLRNTLVTVQFIISIVLIVGTIIVYRQVSFLNSKNLGFNRENIMVINHAERLGSHVEAFRDEVIKIPEVTDAAIGMDVPGGGHYEDIWTIEGIGTKIPVCELKIDDHYFDLLGLKLAAGRHFDKNNPSDLMAAIPNETTIRMFGLTPEEAIGKYIIYPGDDNARLEIIGVAKDFNYYSLYEPIEPMVLINTDAKIWGDMRVIAVKFKTGSVSGLMKQINQMWNNTVTATPFDSTFLEQLLAQQYIAERKLGGLLAILSGLSILVALIGLIGLVSYTVESRKREIGIRKVFGASASQIILLLNNQYVKLIAIAMVISSPLSWWVFQKWLESFSYRIHINGYTYLMAGVIELSITFLCVGYISLRAAMLNPAHVLKDE